MSPTSDMSQTRVRATGASQSRSLAEHLGGSVSIKDFGGTCNGVADDTAALQAALNALASMTTRTIRIPGFPSGCRIGTLTWPSLGGKWVTLEIEGELTLTATFVLPDLVRLRGAGAGTNVQFQRSATAHITGPAGSTAIEVQGITGHELENLSISSDTRGVRVGNYAQGHVAALTKAKNIAISLANTPGAEGWLLDDTFWFDCDDCVVTAGNATGYAIRITQANPSSSFYSGLVTFDHLRTSYQGILIEGDNDSHFSRKFRFRNWTHEMPASAPLVFAPSGTGIIQEVEIDGLEIADPQIPAFDSASIIAVNASGAGKVRGVTLRSVWPARPVPLVRDGDRVEDLRVEGGAELGGAAGFGSGQVPQVLGGGIVDLFDVMRGPGPGAVPFATNACAEAPGAGAGISLNLLAPDGSSGAFQLAGSPYTEFTCSLGGTVAVGDWFIAGAWVEGTPTTAPSADQGIYLQGTSVAFDGAAVASVAVGRYTEAGGQFYAGAGWTPLVTAHKISAATGLTAGNTFWRGTVATPTKFWRPFVMRIPAGTMTDADVRRLMKQIIPPPPSTGGAGKVVIGSGQSYCVGAACWSTSSAAPVGACTSGSLVTRTDTTGGVYSCVNSTWVGMSAAPPGLSTLPATTLTGWTQQPAFNNWSLSSTAADGTVGPDGITTTTVVQITTGAGAQTGIATPNYITVAAGDIVTLEAWMKSGTASAAVLYVFGRDSGLGGAPTASTYKSITMSAGWQKYSLTWTIPAGINQIQPAIIQSGTTAGQTFYAWTK